jgi:hypothetical protein
LKRIRLPASRPRVAFNFPNLVPGSISSTGFVLYAINAPAASQGSTAYTLNYVVVP